MMRWLCKLFLRLRSLFGKDHVEQELSEELRFHLEKLIEENVARGMSAEEARYAALREMGGIEQIKEECREARGVRFIETLVQDVRFGLRLLVKDPGFTVVAVITLALGIGVTTTIFTAANDFLLRPLPFSNSERLVMVKRYFPGSPTVRNERSAYLQVLGGTKPCFRTHGRLERFNQLFQPDGRGGA